MLCAAAAAPIFSHYACAKGGAVLRYSYCAYRVSAPPSISVFLSLWEGGALTVLYGICIYIHVYMQCYKIHTYVAPNMCVLIQLTVLEGRSGRSVVLPAPSHVTTITHHWPAQSSVWRDVSVLRGKWSWMEPALTLLCALVSTFYVLI